MREKSAGLMRKAEAEIPAQLILLSISSSFLRRRPELHLMLEKHHGQMCPDVLALKARTFTTSGRLLMPGYKYFPFKNRREDCPLFNPIFSGMSVEHGSLLLCERKPTFSQSQPHIYVCEAPSKSKPLSSALVFTSVSGK